MNNTFGLRKNSFSALQAVAGDPSVLDSQHKHKEPMAWKTMGRKAMLMLLLAGCACLAYSQSVTAGSAQKSGSSSTAGPPSELYSCINDGFDQQLTTYRDFAYQKPVRCARRVQQQSLAAPNCNRHLASSIIAQIPATTCEFISLVNCSSSFTILVTR
jgi:hypothetical protein